MKRAPAVVVLVTVGSADQGAEIARSLVEDRLAACANIIGPMRSIYRWQEVVQDEGEYLLVIKTRKTRLAALESRVRTLHSYETPEVLALTVESGSAAYLRWVFESTAPITTKRRAAKRRKLRR
jgi:periplasmic divalent cation tolerance protein